MNWHPRWPFKSRDQALAYEKAYMAGSYKDSETQKRVRIVDKCDLEVEKWLESHDSERLRLNTNDHEAIRNIYLWKMRSTNRCAEPPSQILTSSFGYALNKILNSNDDEMSEAIECLTEFKDIKVRVASAFIYWLRPTEYQIIDRNTTAALNLNFQKEDYTIRNYLEYCHICRKLSMEHDLSLRQMDRALFTYCKLFNRQQPIVIPDPI